jgi:hypothetical protein
MQSSSESSIKKEYILFAFRAKHILEQGQCHSQGYEYAWKTGVTIGLHGRATALVWSSVRISIVCLCLYYHRLLSTY